MPNPKRRHSKSRRDKRRTHDNVSLPQTTNCSRCASVRRAHSVCPSCGYYKGKKVLDIDKKKQRKARKRESKK